MGDFENQSLALLRQLTGSETAEFRAGQVEAIKAVAVDGRRALVVQRTGWGKSAVYLISTKLLRDRGAGPTVIVSPLLALMRNQLEMTRMLDLNAATINAMNTDQWDEVIGEIQNGDIDLLLISPERLQNERFNREVAEALFKEMGLLVIDEVHCISDWGHDFRPDYRRLQRVVASLPPRLPVLGTTATANDRVIADVVEQLGAGLDVHRGTLARESLSLHILELPHQAQRMAWLGEHIPTMGGSGIVYCLTIRDAERLAAFLNSEGIRAAAYTGQTDDGVRLDIEKRLTKGELKVVIATSALAMGYDNPYIEFVIHYQIPGSPIAYYQQVGRAGRAVETAYGIAMVGAEDRDIQNWFIETAFPSEEDTARALDVLSRSDGMTRSGLLEHVNVRVSRLDGMLKILEVEGAVYKEGYNWFRSASKWSYPKDRVDAVTESRRQEQAAMVRYTEIDTCLMQFLRSELDDPAAAPCGKCANCTGEAFSLEIDGQLIRRALASFRREDIPIEPRKMLPCDLGPEVNIKEFRLEQGRCLTRWSEPGLGDKVRDSKEEDVAFDSEVLDECLAVIGRWAPQPRPQWITWIPSSSGSLLIPELAASLGERLGLPVIDALRRIADRPSQKTMENSCQQARNVHGAFEIVELGSGPVLLVDDLVDSRWTFTILGNMLRRSGAGEVYPLALADTSEGG